MLNIIKLAFYTLDIKTIFSQSAIKESDICTGGIAETFYCKLESFFGFYFPVTYFSSSQNLRKDPAPGKCWLLYQLIPSDRNAGSLGTPC
jgi:hypothetical protein